jgi:hypothetical protein
VWQELRTELHPKGLEVVTVALDVKGAEAAGKFIDAANAEHPSLIDDRHFLGESLGVVNVPSGTWIDEEGMIVRPPEPAWPGRSMFREMMPAETPKELDPYLARSLDTTRKIKVNPAKYGEALRDWVTNGPTSTYALSPDEVIARAQPRPPEHALAAAHFELGQHLYRTGATEAGIGHLREAHRLHPQNWTYKRQSWSMVSWTQGPSEEFEGDWAGDVEKYGPENYYRIADDMQ